MVLDRPAQPDTMFFEIDMFYKKLIDWFGSSITTFGFLKKYKITSGDIVIDAGAYLGHFTILAAKKVGKSGKVIAFEPSPANFKILNEKISRSGFKNILVIKKALYDKRGTLFFSKELTSKSPLKEYKDKKHQEKVKSTTLDYELEKRGIKKVDFIKMDIEGAEIEAIKGGEKVLSNTKNFAIACYHKRNNVTTDKIINPLLTKMGFKTSKGFFLHLTLYGSK